MMTINWSQFKRSRQGLLGIGTILAGIFVLSSPLFLSKAILGGLGILLLILGVFSFFTSLRGTFGAEVQSSYLQSIVTMLLGMLLLLSPNLVLSGIIVLMSLFYIIEGGTKLYAGLRGTTNQRFGDFYNGIFNILLGIAIWYFVSSDLGLVVVIYFIGLRLLAQGWRLLMVAQADLPKTRADWDFRQHIDPALKVKPNQMLERIQRERFDRHLITQNATIAWSVTFLLIFFFIHMVRTGGNWSILGVITPFSAVLGDILVAFLVALLIILPTRLFWQWVLRRVEEAGWNYLIESNKAAETYSLGERLLHRWLIYQLDFLIQLREMRNSLQYTFWHILSLGISITAVIIAINSIWGFSWYFNSENWASAVWQSITQNQVDTWRQSMATAVEKSALKQGVDPAAIFAVTPAGVNDNDDFSFIVIGDPGEGDASQQALVETLMDVGRHADVKFAVISSDIIYPDGRMRDYEKNFYLPFKGFTKPLYAIPGNHDWYNSNQGFIANFFQPDAALVSLNAQFDNDVMAIDPLADSSHEELIAQAARLRSLYQIQNGLQRASYFELQSAGFSLIAVDTGILRTVDEQQMQWLEAALQRAGDNFKFVVLGHPFYAAGADQVGNDAAFAAIHDLLSKYQVDVAMAGDTHDFEFYREIYQQNGSEHAMLNFVNGGGGAYLSIGTALDFSATPATADYAFYPRTDTLLKKLDDETPGWKRPVLFWIRQFNGYPLTTETLSGIFDFNNAPFFQSLMEIKVERSKNQVRLLLYGVDGQLRWKDLQLGGSVKPADQNADDFVEFVRPLRKQ